MAHKASHTGRQQPRIAAVLAVLVLAVAVQATENQLPHIKAPQLPWEKLPFVSRFSKAAQAAKAAAAAITVSHTLPKTPSLPPAAPVAAAPAHQPSQAAAGTTAGAGVPNAPAPNPPADASKKGKKGKELKQLPTTGKNETQAGCSCLTDWESKPGGAKLSGCANPDNDPLGSWCQVDPAQCLGYYSMYRTEKGKLKFYDYCVPVRERTKQGCLCSSDWAPAEGQVGKLRYRDGCARPNADKGPRICKVDAATCPPGVDPAIEYDECKDKQEQMVLPQDKTWHNCGCVTGWSYKYEDGTSAIFSTCANPDSDPLGHWCEVDPNKCDNFATVLKNGDQKMSIDYCGSKYKTPQPQSCKAHLKLNDQCGGKSNCTHSGCLNAPWPGACCPRGSECRMQDAFFYQCLPLDADQTSKTYRTAPVAATTMGAVGEVVVTKAQPPAPAPAKKPEPVPQHEIAQSSLEGTSTAETPGEGSGSEDEPREAGQRLWVKLRLSMDYDLLAAQPQLMTQFKSDVAQFLKEVVGDTKYIYGTGVDEVLAGSVIAICYIDFTKDCPSQAVDAAMEQLHTNGQSMFADSGLPAKYGWLLSYNMGQLKSDVVQDGPGDIPIQSMNFPPLAEKRSPTRGNSKVSLTITVVIAVGVLVVIVGIVGAVLTMRHRRAKRRRQQQRPKKKVPPKIKDKIGGGGATVSGYLADLDGMLDDEGDSDKIKSSTGQNTAVSVADTRPTRGSRDHHSARSTHLHGSSGSRNTGNSKRSTISEQGGTVQSRLWHWLQKAEPPTTVDTRLQTVNTNSPLSSPEVSCNISTVCTKNTPRASSVLPTPRGGNANTDTIDISDPGTTFRVPPPSPRYNERPGNSQSTEAAAVAAALGGHGTSNSAGALNTHLSPRPAPTGATLMGSSNSKSSMHTSSERRRTNPALPPVGPPSMISPGRSATTAQFDFSGSNTNSRSFILDTVGAGGGFSGLGENYGISTIHPTSRIPADSGDLPPGISMGPFLRAAIKSLTGQSLGGGSTYGSEGGVTNNNAPAMNPSSGMYANQASSPSRGASPVPGSQGHGSSSNSSSYQAGGNPTRQGQGHGSTVGAGAMAAAVRASAQAQAEQDAAEDPGMGAGSGSVFQSLWMQRLVAAAQAQQADLMPPASSGRPNVRLEDAHMYGQPRR